MSKFKIPFGSVSTGDYARYKVLAALDSNQLTEGPNVREFEHKWAAMLGYKHGIGAANGTLCGTIVWAAVREQKRARWYEGEIITPVSAYFATASCILEAGCKPRFV